MRGSPQIRFAAETPRQIAKHIEIARRHRRPSDNGAAFIGNLRIAELQRIFVLHYQDKRLPNDTTGRASLRLMADHLAQIDPRLIPPWASKWLPEATATEIDVLMATAGRRWKADALGRELGLDDKTRTRLKIKTIGAIDCGKAKRMTRRRRKRIAADRARRAKVGARPHSQSAEALMPWVTEGVSRRTWYRRRAELGTRGTDSRPIVRSTSIDPETVSEVQQVSVAKPNPFLAKPLPFPRFQGFGWCEQATVASVIGLDDVSFRAVHKEHFELIKLAVLDAGQKRRLAELDVTIEDERNRRFLNHEQRQTQGCSRQRRSMP